MIRPKLSLNQNQRMTLSPEMHYANYILQLATTDLIKKVQEEIIENPFLEESTSSNSNDYTLSLNEVASNVDLSKARLNLKQTTRSHTFLKRYNNQEAYNKKNPTHYKNIKTVSQHNQTITDNPLEKTIAFHEGLYEYLMKQVYLLNLSEEQLKRVKYIASSLDKKGYFRVSENEWSEWLQCSHSDFAKALTLVQNLEPAGIAGRHLAEVLCLQLEVSNSKHQLALQLIKDHLEEFQRKSYSEWSKEYNCSVDDVEQAMNLIYSLEPIPARPFESHHAEYLSPDFSIYYENNEFLVRFHDEFIPNISLNYEYLQSVKAELDQTNDSTSASFWLEKQKKAEWLISGIERKKQMMLNVVERLIFYQKDFFQYGKYYLRPILLKTMAKELNLHESTTSRLVSNKYVETQWGVFSFKYFFSSGFKSKTTGESISAHSIRHMIKDWILEVKLGNRLTDEKISQRFRQQGFYIARRTITKYRHQMKLHSLFRQK